MSTITPLPTAPTRTDPTTFSARGDAWDAALVVFGPEVNAVAAEVNANALAAAASATTAAGAATAAGATIWVSGTTYSIGNTRFSPLNAQTYRRITAGAGTTDPSLDATNWVRVNLTPNLLTRSARTSNTVLGLTDSEKLIDITSGTFSQTFDAAATLADGWYCYIRNSGTGTITLDPNAAELIDGAATSIMYPGECRLVQCDGAALRSIVIKTAMGDHEVVVHTGNGNGSTNTRCRRFTTALVNTGTAITYADSAANGASFTVNEDGIYAMYYQDVSVVGGWCIAISLNATTDSSTIAVASRLAAAYASAGSLGVSCARVARLTAGAVIRANGNANTNATDVVYFAIRKVGV